jgi:hypothetical protein
VQTIICSCGQFLVLNYLKICVHRNHYTFLQIKKNTHTPMHRHTLHTPYTHATHTLKHSTAHTRQYTTHTPMHNTAHTRTLCMQAHHMQSTARMHSHNTHRHMHTAKHSERKKKLEGKRGQTVGTINLWSWSCCLC